MNLILWFMNSQDVAEWLDRLVPATLEGFGPKIRVCQHLGLDYVDAFLLFSEIRLQQQGETSESFSSMAEWFNSLGESWQSDRRHWHREIRDRLITRRPSLISTFRIYENGAVKTSVPRSFAEFEQMFNNNAITIMLT